MSNPFLDLTDIFLPINVHIFDMYVIMNTCTYRIYWVLIKVCTQLREKMDCRWSLI